LSILITLVLVACASPADGPAASTSRCTSEEPATSSGVPAPDPEPESVTVVGRVVAEDTCEPLDGATVRLGEIYERQEGRAPLWKINEAFSPFALVDSTGAFTMTNIEAHEYVVVVGDLLNQHVIVRDPEVESDARILELQEGEVFDIGEVRVDASRVTY
jgi:hypothetical protein